MLQDELLTFRLDDVLDLFSPEYRQKILNWCVGSRTVELANREQEYRLHGRQGKFSWVDLLLTKTIYGNHPAIQMIWIDNSARLSAEEQLSENIWRVQILYDINQAIRTTQDIKEISKIVLQHMSYLIPEYLSSYIYLLNIRLTGSSL